MATKENGPAESLSTSSKSSPTEPTVSWNPKPKEGSMTSREILHSLRDQNQRMKDSMQNLHKKNQLLSNDAERVATEKKKMEKENVELRKRINGYQNLNQMYHDVKKEAKLYRQQLERQHSQPLVPTTVINSINTSLNGFPSNMPSTSGEDSPSGRFDSLAATGAKLPLSHSQPQLADTYTDVIWSMSQRSMEPSGTMASGNSILESNMTASFGDTEQGIQHILTWMCNTVGMRSISPLADILIRMVLSVLRTEKETYEKKATTPKDEQLFSTTVTQEHRDMLENAIKQLKEQEKVNFALQQHSKKMETEKHTLEMDKRLWLIEQDCLKEQLRSLKADLERYQQENVSLRHNFTAMNNETSLTSQESLQCLSPQELRTEVAVLRHQVTVYQEDFDRERHDREQSQTEKTRMQQEMNQIKQDLERKTEQLSSKEREHSLLLEKFNLLNHEYRERVQELARLRPLQQNPEMHINRPLPYAPNYFTAGAARSASPPDLGWECLRCTFINNSNKSHCHMCNSHRRDFPGFDPSFLPEYSRQPSSYIAHGRIECDTKNASAGYDMSSDMPLLPSILPDVDKD